MKKIERLGYSTILDRDLYRDKYMKHEIIREMYETARKDFINRMTMKQKALINILGFTVEDCMDYEVVQDYKSWTSELRFILDIPDKHYREEDLQKEIDRLMVLDLERKINDF